MLRHYEDVLRAFRDVKCCVGSADEKGRAEGREEGRAGGIAIGGDEAKIEIARRMLAKGFSEPDICEATGLQEEELATIT